MGPAPPALPSLKVPVRSRCAALALREDIGVHPEAHRAARLPPFKARSAEDLVKALRLGTRFYVLGAGNDHRPNRVGDAAAVDHRGRLTQILDSRVGAGADEDPIQRHLGNRGARP